MALAIGLGLGYLLGVQKTQVKIAQRVLAPSPTPSPSDKFENIKAEVKLADGKKFAYIQDGKEKTITDLSQITVWKSFAPGDQPKKTDWKEVKPGTKVQLAIEKATGKIVAVLVL